MPFDFESATPVQDGKAGPQTAVAFDWGSAKPAAVAAPPASDGQASLEPLQAPKRENFLDTLARTFKGAASGAGLGLGEAIGEKAAQDVNLDPEGARKRSIARSQNMLAISEAAGLPLSQVADHYDDLIRDPKVTGIKGDFSSPLDALQYGAMIEAPFAFLENPWGTFKGLMMFGALDKLVPTDKLLPKDMNRDLRTTLLTVDFLAKGAITAGVYGKMSPLIDEAVERFTLNKLEEYKLPTTVVLERDQVRDIWQTGELTTPEQKDLLKSLDLTKEQLRAAIDHGINIAVPAEKITRVTSKPYWEKVQRVFGIEPGETILTEQAGQVAKAPKGLLAMTEQEAIVQKGGGKYLGYQKPTLLKSGRTIGDQVYFNSPTSGSTLALKSSELSAEAVKRKIVESDTKFNASKYIGGGEPPKSGLVVAAMGADGKMYYGKPGDLHFNLSEKYGEQIRQAAGLEAGQGTWKQLGFADSTGKIFSPEEAAKLVKGKSPKLDRRAEKLGGQLDALDYRETLGQEQGFMDPNLMPGFAETADALKKSHDQLTETFNAAKVSEPGEIAAATLRENLGEMARSTDKVEAALEKAKKLFDKAPKDANLDFIYRLEEGNSQDSPELQKIADGLRALLDQKRKEVQDLGTGKLESFIENYFPHIWEDPKAAVDVMKKFFGKRPLEGSKSFLKKRKIETVRAGIEKGLVPVSYNPVDLTMLKIREMDRYVMAHKTLNTLKEEGIVKYVRVGAKAPEGWVKIDDKISTVVKSPLIPIKEAFDEMVMEKLEEVARNLGISHERLVKLKGFKKGGDTWGFSVRGEETGLGTARPGRIASKFGGPESVIAHEIGHQLDEMYGLKEKFLPKMKSNKVIDKLIEKIQASRNLTPEEKAERIAKWEKAQDINAEFQKLADLRFEGKNPGPGFRNYVREGSEKMAVMLEAYIHAPDKFKRVAPTLFEMYEQLLESDPALKPLMDIEPSLVLGSKRAEVHAGGMVIAGYLYAQPDAARIVNNYLKPGLRGNYFYDALRGAGNAMNQFQLGISAFHLGFTSMDATISRFALGLNQLFAGRLSQGLSAMASAPVAPITNVMKGDKLLNAWYGKPTDARTAVIADLMASAGGRARMDKFYATEMADKITKALQEGKWVTAAMQWPMRLVEKMANPILAEIVPRQKLGVFFDLMNFELERHPDVSHEELRAVAQKAWDSVDNRMGQLVYDNLFWSRTTKDLAMASMRSVGWNLGTIRELGGGVKDLGVFMKDAAQGKKPDVSYRMAYLIALPAITALYGAIYQYLHTGDAPGSMRDMFYPRNGKVDRNGRPARISLPTYMKDVYHYTQHPIQTVKNKFSPVFNTVIEMLDNKDFYGVKIRNEDDPWYQQAFSEMLFLMKQNIPFALRNASKNLESANLGPDMTPEQLRQAALDVFEPQIGITPAPYDINLSDAEYRAAEIARGKIPEGARTQTQHEKSQLKSGLIQKFMNDKTTPALDEAVAAGKITLEEKRKIIEDAKLPYLQRVTKSFTAEEVASVMHKADEEEKKILQPILKAKIDNRLNRDISLEEKERLEELRQRYFGS